MAETLDESLMREGKEYVVRLSQLEQEDLELLGRVSRLEEDAMIESLRDNGNHSIARNKHFRSFFIKFKRALKKDEFERFLDKYGIPKEVWYSTSVYDEKAASAQFPDITPHSRLNAVHINFDPIIYE